MVNYLLLCSILMALLVIGPEPAYALPLTVRVAVQKQVAAVRLTGERLQVRDEKGTVLDVDFPLVARRSGNSVSAGGMRVKALKVRSPGYLRINGKGYRGTTEVTASGRGLLVINEVDIEEYLVGLINCEISSRWPMEVVKAQAVIARSYALFQREARKNQPFHLESTVMDQVYNGCDIEDGRAAAAVAATRHEVLTYNGRVVQAFFHSRCGGHTEASENVWSLTLPYLRGVSCTYCAGSPSSKWEVNLARNKVEALLRTGGYQVRGIREIRPVNRYQSGRIADLEVVSDTGSVFMPAVVFRRLAGYAVIRSTDFEARMMGDSLLFSGNGNGHGVGLCQWGARQQAEEGRSYREILSYYYPGVGLGRIAAD
jgi:stage II sporulation protein D